MWAAGAPEIRENGLDTVLIVDDNRGVCTALEVLLSLYDMEVLTANSPQQALELLEKKDIQLVIQDMNFTEDTTSGKEGESLFRDIRTLDSSMPVILLTAWAHLEAAVSLVREGAADYLQKPWDDEKLVASVRNLIKLRRTEEALLERQSQQRIALEELSAFDLCGTVFASAEMLQVVRLATQVAHADVPVLITGPNGAGKEKIAQIVHANSRRKGDFVAVNMGAMPETLIESELFGAEAGAFTGAKKTEGRFIRANGGTLFLDEIGNLPLNGQMKLLRVLQTGEFEKLGSGKVLHTDARLITATNADLGAAIAEGSFREDLFYRINVIEIRVPPLNRRVDDILPLARHFLGQERSLSAEAESQLLAYHWPGNVRELENCMRRAALLGSSEQLAAADLGLNLAAPAAGSAGAELSETDVRNALELYNGVVSRAAKSLGLSRQAMYRRMEKYQIR